MGKNKYEFISEILESRKFNQIQKERLFSLIAHEIKNYDLSDLGIIKRIEEIEKILDQKIPIEKRGESSGNLYNKERKLHRPQETYKLLNKFSSTEGGIKNLTHTFNYGYIDYETFISKCKKEFEEGKSEFLNVPDALLKRIEEFAFYSEPKWFIRKGKEKKNIVLGWSEPKFVQWYKENTTHPADNAYYNKEMIIPFKETIQVRADTGNMSKLLYELKSIVYGDKSLVNLHVKESIKNSQFYTDVDNLGQAIYHILSMLKHYSELNFCNEVEIDYQIEGKFKTLSFTHFDSSSTKNSNEKDFMGGDLKTIRNSLWGLCNYDIIARFPDGCFRKVILSDDSKDFESSFQGEWVGKSYPIEKSKVDGFTHILKFY